MRDEVLQTTAGIIREVIAEPWAEEIPITFETSFSQDLELESIEFVALAGRLQDQYGSRVDFGGWLAGKELDEIIELRVGEVVDFIVTCLSSTDAA